MKIQWQIHFSYAELWLQSICKDRRGQHWEDNKTAGYTSLFLIGSTPPPLKKKQTTKNKRPPKPEKNDINTAAYFL